MSKKSDGPKAEGNIALDKTCAPLDPKPEISVSIVDDHDSIRETMKRLVTSLGYSTATFSSAEEFLNSDQLHETSILISDVHMPGMSGIELQRHLLQHGHHIPIIFVSAHPEERLRAYALAAGAVGFLSKAFTCDQLAACLAMALEGNRSKA